MNSPRVLLSAYHCAPGGGSVSQIGWEWYWRLSKETPVTLLTHSRNQSVLEAAGAPLPGSDVIYINTEWFARPLYRFAQFVFRHSEHAVFLLSSADFFVYDAVALRELRKLRHQFDVVHSVTPVSPLAVTRLHKLGVPTVVGPWNGGMNTMRGFHQIMQSDSEWIYRVRFLRGLLDRLAGCTHRASRVLSATSATDRCLPGNVATERMIENGVDLDQFHPQEGAPPSVDARLEVLFVGRLIPAKGISMLVEAAARVKATVPLRINIVGTGSMLTPLEEQVRRAGLEGVVVFSGTQPLDQIAVLMRGCHLFCLPSIRESGGAVILEAMASGVPVLTVAHGGPGELVDEEVGRALQADCPETLIRGLAEALTDAYHNRQSWIQRGNNGRSRAEQVYGWPGRVRRIVDLYRRVIKEKDERSRSRESHRHGTRFASPERSD